LSDKFTWEQFDQIRASRIVPRWSVTQDADFDTLISWVTSMATELGIERVSKVVEADDGFEQRLASFQSQCVTRCLGRKREAVTREVRVQEQSNINTFPQPKRGRPRKKPV
jgi:hypothetical protein